MPGAAKRRRRRKARAKAKTGAYWTCVQIGTGRVCGVHHRKLTGAVSHRQKLDRAARAYAARHSGKPKRWHVEKRA